MKRILHCIPDTAGGGAEVVSRIIANHQRSHYEVHFASFSTPALGFEGIIYHQIVKHRGLLGAIRSRMQVREIIKRVDPDAVLSHLTFMNVIVSLSRGMYLKRTPHILVHHSSNIEYRNRFVRFIVKYIYQRSNVVAVSDDVGRYLVQELHLKKNLVIPNPVELQISDHPIGKNTGIPKSRLLAVGRLSEEKNYSFLLQSLLVLPKKFTLDIFGSGNIDSLMSEIAALGLSDRVKMRGFIPQDQLQIFMKEFDFFVMTSNFEGESLSLLQAAAKGLLVIGRDTPGLGNSVRKVGGFLPENSSSPESFARAIVKADEIGRNSLPAYSWASTHDPALASHKYCLLIDELLNG